MRRTPLFGLFERSLVLATLLLFAQFTQAAGERLLFWRVDTPGATVYLLGSMHLASPDLYPLRAEILTAFEGADALAVELDVDARAVEIQQRMLERGTYPPGETLQDALAPETWQALAARLESSGLPPMLMQSLKPGLVVTTLSTLELMKMGLNPEQGVDRYFLNQARGSKSIVELETVDAQLDVVLDTSQPDLLVKQTLAQLDDMESIMSQLVDYWQRGDSKGLARLVIEDELEKYPEFRDLHRRMFDDRNRLMTDRIVEMQASGGTWFVVVGAGHLVGDQGIVSMLQRRGQSPRQL